MMIYGQGNPMAMMEGQGFGQGGFGQHQGVQGGWGAMNGQAGGELGGYPMGARQIGGQLGGWGQTSNPMGQQQWQGNQMLQMGGSMQQQISNPTIDPLGCASWPQSGTSSNGALDPLLRSALSRRVTTLSDVITTL